MNFAKIYGLLFAMSVGIHSVANARIWEDSPAPEKIEGVSEDYQTIYQFWRDWHQSLQPIRYWIDLPNRKNLEFPLIYPLGNIQLQFDPDYVFTIDGSRDRAERSALRWLSMLITVESLQKLQNSKSISPQIKELSQTFTARVTERRDFLLEAKYFSIMSAIDIEKYKDLMREELDLKEVRLEEIKQSMHFNEMQIKRLIFEQNKQLVNGGLNYNEAKLRILTEANQIYQYTPVGQDAAAWARVIRLRKELEDDLALRTSIYNESGNQILMVRQEQKVKESEREECQKGATKLKSDIDTAETIIKKRRDEMQGKFSMWGHEGSFTGMSIKEKMRFEKMRAIDQDFAWSQPDSTVRFSYWQEWKAKGQALYQQMSDVLALREKVESKLKLSVTEVPDALVNPESQVLCKEIDDQYQKFRNAFLDFQAVNTAGINAFFEERITEAEFLIFRPDIIKEE